MDGDVGPHGCLAYYHFGPRGDRPPVKVTWYDGGLGPERPAGLPANERLPGRSILFVGDKGVLLCGGAGGKPRLLGPAAGNGLQPPVPTLPRSPGHHREWLDACKGGQPAGSNFEYGARLTEIVLLGVLALRTGQRIQWDADAMKAKGLAQADAIIKESYRKGWEIA
jgi:hypothetical protein